MAGALEQARVGRLHILDRMLEALAQPRTDISPYAPRILTIRVPVDKIRDIIGPGGKMIRSIVERTGCKIDVEDDGRVSIASVDESAARKAIAIIEELTATPELNKSYLGKVVRVVEFGAFVEILPGTDGLLHVSEMAHHRVNNVHDEVKEGDQVLVKVVSIDPSGQDPALPQGPARGGGGRRPPRAARAGRAAARAAAGRRPRPRPRARPRPRRRRRARSRPAAGRRSRRSRRARPPRPRPRAVRAGRGGGRPLGFALAAAAAAAAAGAARGLRRRGPRLEARLRALAHHLAPGRDGALRALLGGRRALLRDRRAAHREADRAGPAHALRPHARPDGRLPVLLLPRVGGRRPRGSAGSSRSPSSRRPLTGARAAG